VRLGEWKLSVLLDEHLSATSATFATLATGFAVRSPFSPMITKAFILAKDNSLISAKILRRNIILRDVGTICDITAH
jgi:hypothetical protein